MNIDEKVLKAIENFITQREAESKKENLNYKLYKSENKNTITNQWTLTQLHTVAIIKENRTANNNFLSQELNISKPAVTKAVKKLLDYNIIIEIELENNRKETYYTLTDQGESLAFLHDKLHEEVKQKYIKIFEEFPDSDLEVVRNFLENVTRRLQEEAYNNESL